MQQTIIQNTEYYFSGGISEIIKTTPDNKESFFKDLTLHKISLFSDLAEIEQEIIFKSLLNKVNIPLIFSKSTEQKSIIWNCFIKQENLPDLIKNIIQDSIFDYIVWPTNHFSPPKLMVFDMDSTFIQIEVIDELAKAHNVGDKVSQVTESAMRGELDFSKSLITRIACLKGLTSESINTIADNLPLSPGVEELVAWAHQNDVKIAIVSGGFTPFVKKLAMQMNLFKVKANDLEIVKNKLTGKVLGDIVDAQAKADFINELKVELNLKSDEIMSIGDGANDLLMMKETGFSLAYRAKPAVDKEAGGRMTTTHLDRLIDVFTK